MIPVPDQPPNVRPDATKIVVTTTRPEHVPALAALQKLVFPTLDPEERFTEAKYLSHIEIFPEGQFVALYPINGQLTPVAATSTFRTHFDFKNSQHTYLEAIASGWLTNHDPSGEWLYGSDMSVHPAYRGLRIGRKLYEARRDVVRRLNLRGEIAGALIPGYLHHDRELTVAQYVLRVWQGKLQDPTLSMQIRNGFRVRGILYDHISDPRSGNCATLIVRENPHYQPPSIPAQRESKSSSANAEHRAGHVRRPNYRTYSRAAKTNQFSQPGSNQL